MIRILPPAFRSMIKFHLHRPRRILVSEASPVVPPEGHHRDTLAHITIVNSRPFDCAAAREIGDNNEAEGEEKVDTHTRMQRQEVHPVDGREGEAARREREKRGE